MKAKELNITDENIKNYETYEVIKEINLEDGTHIEKGTEFREEGFVNNKYNLHFSQEPGNRYTNGTGEYEFSLSALKDFCVPTKGAVDKELFERAKDKIINSISKEEDFVYINENYGNMDNFTKESIKGSLIDNYIIKSMSEKILEQDHQPGDQEIYEKTEVSKIDSANTIVHIYQFNNEPEKCFLGCKVNNTVKKLGAFATIEGAKKEFKEFMEFEKVSSKTVTKDKTEIQSKNYKEVEELSL